MPGKHRHGLPCLSGSTAQYSTPNGRASWIQRVPTPLSHGTVWMYFEGTFARRPPGARGILINVPTIHPNALPPNITPSASPGYLTPAVWGAHVWAEWLHHPCLLGGPQQGDKKWGKGGTTGKIGGNFAQRAWRANVHSLGHNSSPGGAFVCNASRMSSQGWPGHGTCGTITNGTQSPCHGRLSHKPLHTPAAAVVNPSVPQHEPNKRRPFRSLHLTRHLLQPPPQLHCHSFGTICTTTVSVRGVGHHRVHTEAFVVNSSVSSFRRDPPLLRPCEGHIPGICFAKQYMGWSCCMRTAVRSPDSAQR